MLTTREVTFLTLVVVNGGLLAWMLFLAFTTGIIYILLALLVGFLCVVFMRRAGGFLLSFAVISLSGALGLLLGCSLEFGRVGLFSLSAICQVIAENAAADSAWRMFLLSPVVHLGMWFGCSAALFFLRSVHLVGYALCMFGMVLGMIVSAAFPLSVIVLSSENLVISTVLWLWLWMCVGMALPHCCLRFVRDSAVRLQLN